MTMTSSWRQRFDKAKTHVLNGDPTALVNETKQYLYWKGVLAPPSAPASSADRPALHYPLIGAYRLLTQRLGVSVGSSSGMRSPAVGG